MLERNVQRDLAFADDYLSAILVSNVSELVVDGIVVNLSRDPIFVDGDVQTPIQPWRSTTVRGERIIEAERIAILDIARLENLGGVALRGWDWFGDLYSGFPRETPLYMSPVDTVGLVQENPRSFTRQDAGATPLSDFTLKLKCWWSPNETDCFIHNEHPFLEVHTQIHGLGRMQKFRERNASTIYEDVVMAPGFTHGPFCAISENNEWVYPWHRYYTDTESIWLAIELHPVSR